MAAEPRVDAVYAAGEAPAAEELWDALQVANLPTLLMVLAQLTGERRWLEPPYAPTRTRGMDDNDSGGLPEPIQDEIRRAAFDLLLGGGGPGYPGGHAVTRSPRTDDLGQHGRGSPG